MLPTAITATARTSACSRLPASTPTASASSGAASSRSRAASHGPRSITIGGWSMPVWRRGLEPVVSLLHFTVPRWQYLDGHWHAADVVDRFTRFVEAALPVVADGVRYVCTINEPNIAAMLAGASDASTLVSGALPMPDALVADAQFAAHRRAREVLASVDGLRSGWTVATQAFEASGEPGSTAMVEQYGRPARGVVPRGGGRRRFRRGAGVHPHHRRTGRTAAGRRGGGTNPDRLGGVPRGARRRRCATWPRSAPGCRSSSPRTASRPTTTRNGSPTPTGALAGSPRALADGIDVRGYLHWSALDNYEWAAGYRPTFGLIAVDRVTFVRTPKPSLAWLGSVAVANGLRPA